MKIVIAPDKFKGSLAAVDVALAIEAGLKKVIPQAQTDLIPLADGGEGTLYALNEAVGGKIFSEDVVGPLGKRVQARYAVFTGADQVETAVIEMAEASGLQKTGGIKSPLAATTYGTGELIQAALDQNCRRLIVCLGGSATSDGGVGMTEALGGRFYDRRGKKLERGGGALADLDRIDLTALDKRLADCEIWAACDVTNPLCGPTGAAYVYGPQKGAGPAEIKQLDKGLRQLAVVIKRDLGKEGAELPGAGAAGGLGAGLVAFLGAKLRSGFELVAESVGLAHRLAGAHLIVTGEGRVDAQTAQGKVAVGLASLAAGRRAPVVMIAGSIGLGAEVVYQKGIAAIEPICPGPVSEATAIAQAPNLIEAAAERLARMILAGAALTDN